MSLAAHVAASRRRGAEEKIELQMTPMIDVVFQLLIFFLFTFRIVPVEGEIAVRMAPTTVGAAPSDAAPLDLTERIRVRVTAKADGEIAGLHIGEIQIGPDPRSLTQKLRETFVGPLGEAGDLEVEIDADRALRYRHLIRVTNAIMSAGVSKIDFAEPIQ